MIETTLEKIQNTAKFLFEVQGLSQKEIAKKTGANEKTIGLWVALFQWKKFDVIEHKKQIARQLVTGQNLTQKEAAKIVQISEKTVSKWAMAGKWKQGQTMNEPKPKKDGIAAMEKKCLTPETLEFLKGLRIHASLLLMSKSIMFNSLVDDYIKTVYKDQ